MKYSLKALAKDFQSISDEIRLRILQQIIIHPGISGKALMVDIKISQPSLSFHLKHLLKAKLITYKKDGQTHCYYFNVDTVQKYHEWFKSDCQKMISAKHKKIN